MAKRNLADMMGLDVYLSTLNEDEYDNAEAAITPQNLQTMPLLSWDMFSTGHFEKLINLNRAEDIAKVMALGQKFKWTNDLKDIFHKEEFEALVLTDLHQKIVWVNNGFTEMTGFIKSEAVNNTPRFLQGPKTNVEIKDRFRKKLLKDEPFVEIITNYKKNRTEYACEVKIFPLYNEKTIHYLALEKQVG